MIRKAPEKRTRMKMRRSRVAEGDCLQREGQFGEFDWGKEGLGEVGLLREEEGGMTMVVEERR